jgi:HSP20 family protein
MSDRSDPFQDVEKLLDQSTHVGADSGGDIPVDVEDTGDAFVVVADLPGYDSNDIDVQLEDEYTLSIGASRSDSATTETDEYVRQERHTQQVERTLALPAAVDASATEASHENGVLTVRLGKATGEDDGTDIAVE